MAREIASMPPSAIQSAKEVLRQGMESTLEQAMYHESAVFLNSMKTEEHRLALQKLLDQMKFKNVKTYQAKK